MRYFSSSALIRENPGELARHAPAPRPVNTPSRAPSFARATRLFQGVYRNPLIFAASANSSRMKLRSCFPNPRKSI